MCSFEERPNKRLLRGTMEGVNAYCVRYDTKEEWKDGC